MHSAMTFPTRQAALGVLIVAALSLNASALHVPGRPLGGTMPELQRRAGVERIEALRGGAPLTAVKECFGVRLRSPFHKPAPPPPPPPPVRRTFKERYFKLVETLTLLFPVWTVGLSLIALYNPDRFEWLTTESTTLLEIGGYRLEMDPYTLFLSITMLSMGTNLTPQDFRPIARSVVPISVALLFQYGVTPLIGWAIGQLLPAPLAVGLVLLASCPGSQASNVACFIAGGDLPVSIVMTLLSCSVCAFMTPLLVRLLADASVSVPGVGMMLSLLKVLVPLLHPPYPPPTAPSSAGRRPPGDHPSDCLGSAPEHLRPKPHRPRQAHHSAARRPPHVRPRATPSPPPRARRLRASAPRALSPLRSPLTARPAPRAPTRRSCLCAAPIAGVADVVLEQACPRPRAVLDAQRSTALSVCQALACFILPRASTEP
jgi:hypothetical protein